MIARGLLAVLVVSGCATSTRVAPPPPPGPDPHGEPPPRVRVLPDRDPPPGRWRCEDWLPIEPLPGQPIGERVQVTHWR